MNKEEEEEVKPVVAFKAVKKTNGYSTAVSVLLLKLYNCVLSYYYFRKLILLKK